MGAKDDRYARSGNGRSYRFKQMRGCPSTPAHIVYTESILTPEGYNPAMVDVSAPRAFCSYDPHLLDSLNDHLVPFTPLPPSLSCHPYEPLIGIG